ncbi:pseudouridine synthase [Isoalcanivorax indicus]|uniref:pseudouridine synthase n=1 Tax=Isoalcanivorax indicus TaxID=2202653 RepID=UPI000DBA6534|nr:pseudouridine synthase [Isoalcanivorax indicus]
MRLDYFVAHATGLTRSQVRDLIRRGAVRVDGQPRVRANLKLSGETVYLDDAPLTLPGHQYLMLHKPAGVVCSTDDPGHRTVLDLIPAALRRDLHSAGRLDLDTTGLVLLTSDGQWSHRITSPNSHCPKRYRVDTARPLTAEALAQLAAGVVLRDDPTPTRPAVVTPLNDTRLSLTISEGRYHQVKRMLAAVGNHVVALHREAIGAVELDAELPEGHWRALGRSEIDAFR